MTNRPRLDARLAVGATIGVLLLAVPVVVLVALVATGHTGDRGGLAFLVLLVAAGVYVLLDVRRQAGRPVAPRTVSVADPSGLYGPTEVPAPDGPEPRAGRAVAVVLALLVFGSLAFAGLMSAIDGPLRGRPVLAWAVVTVLVTLVGVGVRWLLWRVTSRRG